MRVGPGKGIGLSECLDMTNRAHLERHVLSTRMDRRVSQDDPGRPSGCRGSRVLAVLETYSSRDREPWRSVEQTPLADIVLRDGLVRTPSPPPLSR